MRPGVRTGSRWTLALLRVAALIPILLLTLQPASDERIGVGWQACIVCGEVGLAAAILNTALFIPFGAALGLGRRSLWVLGLAGFAVSLGIETVQHLLPGRNPTLGDLLFNTAGAVAGVLLGRHWRGWMLPDDRIANRLAVGVSGAIVTIIALTAYAAEPTVPDARYYGLWTPNLRHLEAYDGVVRTARVDSLAIPAGAPFNDRDAALHALRDWSTVEVEGVTGAQTQALAPVVAVFDSARREILLLGVDREDVVLRYRRRAATFRLMTPDTRFAGAAAGLQPAGTDLHIRAQRDGASHCISVSHREQCGLGITAGQGWSLLRAAGTLPARHHPVVNAGWLTVLFLPLGFWLRVSVPAAVAMAAALLAMVLVHGAGTLLPAPPVEWAGVLAGLSTGRLVRSVIASAAGRGEATSVARALHESRPIGPDGRVAQL
jgi:hypothetical protein